MHTFIKCVICAILALIAGVKIAIEENPKVIVQVARGLNAAHAAENCPTTPVGVANFTITLIESLRLRANEHPAFGGVISKHSPTSLHGKDLAVDLTGPREILVTIDKRLKDGLMADYCITESLVVDNHLHLGFGLPQP